MPAEAEKILVIKLGALGDFIQAAGAMEAIRAHHPLADITLLTTAPYAEFAQLCGYFDQIWLDEKPRWTQVHAWRRLRKKLNAENFTRVYDLQNNDRTALYFRLFSPKPEWVGAVKGASHRNDSPDRAAGHAFDGHVQTLSLAGITDIRIDPLEWLQGDLSVFALKKPYVVLVPGSAPGRPEKRWPAGNFAQLAALLVKQGYQPVILGTENERPITQEIAKASGALDLCGRTSLAQIASLARGASGCIGNDTGPVHLAAATGCPVLALFSGESKVIKHGPRGRRAHILQAANLKNLEVETVLENFHPREEISASAASLH